MTVGRFAPSPTGSLHVGNLRTALLAWMFARAEGGRFLLRIEDLDPIASRESLVAEHLADLAALGIDHDGPIERQSSPEAQARHAAALDELERREALYPCFCSRREVAEASQAAHGPGPEGAYPGTCAPLDARGRRSRAEATGRPPSWRVRAEGAVVAVDDRIVGTIECPIDDFVVRRADGVVAYNLAVVVDDAAAGVDQVVRGDDLAEGTPRQAWLADRLGLPRPDYLHVPLVLGPDGERLAKRHGSVTLADLAAQGVTPAELVDHLLVGAGLTTTGVGDRSVRDLSVLDLSVLDLAALDLAALDREPFVFDPAVFDRP